MTLAQVVYGISSDGEFAAQMKADPITALAQHGLQLTKEELVSLTSVLNKDLEDLFGIEDLIKRAGWR